jgi:hypothetical protein
MDKEERKKFWNEIIWFVDDFRRTPMEEKLKEIRTSNEEINAFYAAVVEELAKEHNMAVPKWVFHKSYYLKEPFFLSELNGDYRLIAILEAPMSFKTHNIFIGANTFDRC